MFELRQRLVDDFSDYIRSFLKVKDETIREFVDTELSSGALWPEPLLSLSPTFEMGPLVDELVEKGQLHPSCSAIFKRGKSLTNQLGYPLRLFRHQEEAIRAAQAGRNYVLTTGTGSGKSLSYILPIVDAVLKEGSGKGIRAIVVYPMNALANSQIGELTKYLGDQSGSPAVTFDRYTGQEKQDERDRITKNPPDILLTNFMMLELVLSRPFEKALVDAMSNLQFLVLDELHTYRGRQGADVALLARRLRERSGSKRIQCVGTSATMATEGTALQQREAVAAVATKLFGSKVNPEEVIGETLARWSPAWSGTAQEHAAKVHELIGSDVKAGAEAFRCHPLTAWMESEVGLTPNNEGRLVRRSPCPLYGESGISGRLGAFADIPEDNARLAIQAHLRSASEVPPDPVSGTKPFAFRLHQFLSPGVGVFATIEEEHARTLSLDGQRTAPDDPSKAFFPLAFCRACGQHYFIVTRRQDEAGVQYLEPRRLSEADNAEGAIPGFIFVPGTDGFPDLESLIPEDWMEEGPRGKRVKKNRKEHLPKPIHVEPDGVLGTGSECWFLSAPFCLCVSCRETYGGREGDISKLSVLGLQGRSTATTTLSLSTLSYLRESAEFAPTARKLLTFTDNRQDASLQAGHLNDFVEVGTLRAAIYSAAQKAGPSGLGQDSITLEVERELGLDQVDFAQQPSNLPTQIEAKRRALRDVLGYRIFRDLRRGWRVNAPNLEQVGLLKIAYPDLSFLCSDEDRWKGCNEVLANATADIRYKVCLDLLERLRRKLAIDVRYLAPDDQERMKNASRNLLCEPWGLSEDESERLDTANFAWPDPSGVSNDKSDLLLTPRSGFAYFLRLPTTFPDSKSLLKQDDLSEIIEHIVKVLLDASLIVEVHPRKNDTAYQLSAEAFRWLATDPGDDKHRTHNTFFEKFYRERAAGLKGMYAREHTAQVSSDERERREQDFREAKLPILFCSPTMELGVDIADLNVVSMRNVPPTPANYAQRSGRAGRSGKPALVYTYCTAGSPHDQYFFRRPEQMVAGAVAPPRLDVTNEDLVRAHVQAVWLGEADEDLGKSLADKVLDLSGEKQTFELRDEIKDKLHNIGIRERARSHARAMLAAIGEELAQTTWFSDKWLDEVIEQIPLTFDRACDRWRNLYKSARAQQEVQNRIIVDGTSSEVEKGTARRLRDEAERQMSLLKDASSESMSDFYVYRYLASEGFLPGYNFPRLPLSAYLPGRRGKDEYLSRPRFLAISEFGPGAVVYHEGSRYVVDRVMMPASTRQDSGEVTTETAKLCTSCGYLHFSHEPDNKDLCDRCSADLGLDSVIPNLYRLESVSLRRRDRITSDEEERMRQGYEIRTGIRYRGGPGEEQCSRADITNETGAIATLTYAQAATIRRINIGWNRRKDRDRFGYMLDYQKGKWVASEKDGANSLAADGVGDLSTTTQRVVPYVEDRRNALVFEWGSGLSKTQLASLQAALKFAIQAVYQLEDSEIATEALPSPSDARMLLFFEAAEGGAGVLHRLVDDSEAMARVARAALEICHFDPDTLEDQHRHPRAKDDCSTACYDCLMSYGNQRNHLLLDRREVVDLLAALRDGKVQASSGGETRPEKLAKLTSQCDSGLEKSWLQLLEANNLNLPTYAQYPISDCKTRPDFAYVHGATKVAVYIDGPPHDYPARQFRDQDQELALKVKGWRVHRFHHLEDWETIIHKYPHIYGVLK